VSGPKTSQFPYLSPIGTTQRERPPISVLSSSCYCTLYSVLSTPLPTASASRSLPRPLLSSPSPISDTPSNPNPNPQPHRRSRPPLSLTTSQDQSYSIAVFASGITPSSWSSRSNRQQVRFGRGASAAETASLARHGPKITAGRR
jgi:hypothetical protein